ncbi:unnamed protein product [Cyprideis torosa]|uniref:Uncharacterized protein n=1 Tax=Cyprideis torosa TaxID=163714 RepID=A0A7R8WA22_9CRUS|nr:unnamed protein product [Cyprideis torosa]CAG0885937.1 unnamed protein product [Cyprideis torosa]
MADERHRLLLELQSTRSTLAATLEKVRGLEREAEKVPRLESRIRELERHKRSHSVEPSPRDYPYPSSLEPYPSSHNATFAALSVTADSGLYSDADDSPRGPHLLNGHTDPHPMADAKGVTFANSTTEIEIPPAPPRSPKLQYDLEALDKQLEWLREQFNDAEDSWANERRCLQKTLRQREKSVGIFEKYLVTLLQALDQTLKTIKDSQAKPTELQNEKLDILTASARFRHLLEVATTHNTNNGPTANRGDQLNS